MSENVNIVEPRFDMSRLPEYLNGEDLGGQWIIVAPTGEIAWHGVHLVNAPKELLFSEDGSILTKHPKWWTDMQRRWTNEYRP